MFDPGIRILVIQGGMGIRTLPVTLPLFQDILMFPDQCRTFFIQFLVYQFLSFVSSYLVSISGIE
jgi:hypothetical protein